MLWRPRPGATLATVPVHGPHAEPAGLGARVPGRPSGLPSWAARGPPAGRRGPPAGGPIAMAGRQPPRRPSGGGGGSGQKRQLEEHDD